MTVALRGFEHMVGHLVNGRRRGIDAVHLRIGQEGVHHFVHAMIERGGEQHDLRVERNLAKQTLDWRKEAHIGHLVSLVNNRNLNLVQGERALFDQILKTTRAGHHNIGAGLKVTNLTRITHTAVYGGGVDAVDLGERHEHVVDLVGELTGRSKHQTTWMRHEIVGTTFLGMGLLHTIDLVAELAHVLILAGIHFAQASDQRNRKCQRLAGAGTTAAKNVSPSQRIGKRVGLNRESGFLVIGRKHADQRTRNAEFGERQRAFLFLAHRFGSGCEGIFIKNGIGHNGLSCQILRTLRKLDNCSLCPILLLTFLQSFISVIFTPDCG